MQLAFLLPKNQGIVLSNQLPGEANLMLLRAGGSNLKGESTFQDWASRVMVAGKPEGRGLSAGYRWEARELGSRSPGRALNKALIHPRSWPRRFSKRIWSREMPRVGLHQPWAQRVSPSNHPNIVLGDTSTPARRAPPSCGLAMAGGPQCLA